MAESMRVAVPNSGRGFADEAEADGDDASLGADVGAASAAAAAPAGGGAAAAASAAAAAATRQGRGLAAAEPADSGLSLPQLFRKCDFQFKRMDMLSGPKLEKACAEAVRDLLLCDGYVKRLGLFSKNEELVDISTSHLKYLLIHFYLAKLVPRVFAPQPAARLQHIRRALVHATHFMETCFRFSVMTRPQRERWDALVKSDAGDGSADAGSGGGGGGGAAASARGAVGGVPPGGGVSREARIAAYKREKELKEFLAEVEERHGGAVDGDDGAGGADADDEEEVRRMYLARLELAISTTFADISMLEREVEMLNFRLKMDSDPNRAHGARATDTRLQAAGGGAAADGGNYTGGIEITRISANMEITREKLREGVFKPFHILPTMELAEFAEAEVANAIEREKRQKEAQTKRVMDAAELHREGLEDDEELADAAVYKDRAWANWTDENPKGSGLTKKF